MKPFVFFHRAALIAVSAFCLIASITACEQSRSRQMQTLPVDITITKPDTHIWYYFTPSGYAVVDLPQHSPQVLPKPWTEAVRIAGAGITTDKAYALVNRSGLLEFENDNGFIFQDTQTFTQKTADDLVFVNDRPTFLIYRNTFFSTNNTKGNGNEPILMQFNSNTGISYPLLYRQSLRLSANSEITDMFYSGTNWYGCIKTITEKRILFSYVKIPQTVIVELGAASISENDLKRYTITVDEYRKASSPYSFAQAPTQLKDLLSAIPADYPFFISVQTKSGSSITQYVQNTMDPNAQQGYAIISDTWTAAVFADGTAYFSGATAGRSVPQRGKKTAFRLPKLPAGYVYSSFTVLKDRMYVAWEQTDFYKTGRSGFIEVDLGKILYGDIS